jgi:formylglycine-generating enzyme required for sulfatase activity
MIGAEPGTKVAPPPSSSGPASEADSGASRVADAGIDGGPDAALDSGADSGSSSSSDAGGTVPLSRCQVEGDGVTRCGASGESCCTSLEVPGGTYDRTYTSSGSGPTGGSDPASVSGFRLDKYLVTVGRFRQFVNAWNGGSGYAPPAGSGKHAHLHGGQGLSNSGGDAGGAYETGWVSSDDRNIAPTDANLACESNLATWTTSAGSSESLPINCVNWWESFAFCIWDGGFLPSESEWEYAAAGGSEERGYPWGSTDPGTSNQYAIYDCNYPSGSGGCTGGAAPVGTATLGAGLWGQLDLAGNVNEWNADWFASYAGPCTDCADLTAASFRVIRGGYFDNDPSYLLPPGRSDDPPTVRSICLGLRCARGP